MEFVARNVKPMWLEIIGVAIPPVTITTRRSATREAKPIRQDQYCGKDRLVPTITEYGRPRAVPFYWTLNETAIDLQASDSDGMLTVTLDTVTPNFDKFLISMDDGKWEAKPSSFAWKLHPGENKLQVKSVNKFGVAGVEPWPEDSHRSLHDFAHL